MNRARRAPSATQKNFVSGGVYVSIQNKIYYTFFFNMATTKY